MGTVHNLNPHRDLEDFCKFLWGMNTGYVYMPIKEQETGKWEEGFNFEWPAQKDKIIEHVFRYGKAHNVFMAPALFSRRSNLIEDVQGSQVAWAEFDGKVPSASDMKKLGIPSPTLRVRSSVPGKEHWYWRYEQFQTDLSVIQDTNKALAYALGADPSGWDAGQVLRPVGSFNHKYESTPEVVVINNNHTSYGVQSFANIPVPQDDFKLADFDRRYIPRPDKTLLRYSWLPSEIELITRPNVPTGSRSSALAKLGYTLAEKGLDNNEMYAVIEWADSRWKKFADRSDAEKYYVRLINSVRVKYPYQTLKVSQDLILPFMSYKELKESQDNVTWLIDGILPDKGLLFIVGKSGDGKTIMATGLCKKLAVGGEYLTWSAVDRLPKRIFYLSLEMNTGELKLFFNKQDAFFNETEQKLLEENFYTFAARQDQKYISVKFYQPESVTRLIATIEHLQPDIILVDSATKAIAVDMNNQPEVTKSMELIYRIRNELNCSMIVIHHTRKNPPSHGFKEADIDDMFGAQALQQDASAIIAVSREKDTETGAQSALTNITYLKTRFTGDSARSTVRLDKESLMFRRENMGILVAKAEIPKQREPKPKKDSGKSAFDF